MKIEIVGVAWDGPDVVDVAGQAAYDTVVYAQRVHAFYRNESIVGDGLRARSAGAGAVEASLACMS